MDSFIEPPLFSLEGQIFNDATIFKIYDGDTMRIALDDFNGKPTSFKVRVRGIDTPEIRTKSVKEKELALKAKEEVVSHFNLKKCKITCGDWDKYGRLLVDIENKDGLDLATHLIENKLACKYEGKTKITNWDEW